jgi:hypothetical protein
MRDKYAKEGFGQEVGQEGRERGRLRIKQRQREDCVAN